MMLRAAYWLSGSYNTLQGDGKQAGTMPRGVAWCAVGVESECEILGETTAGSIELHQGCDSCHACLGDPRSTAA